MNNIQQDCHIIGTPQSLSFHHTLDVSKYQYKTVIEHA